MNQVPEDIQEPIHDLPREVEEKLLYPIPNWNTAQFLWYGRIAHIVKQHEFYDQLFAQRREEHGETGPGKEALRIGDVYVHESG